jgi:hypothetical protein
MITSINMVMGDGAFLFDAMYKLISAQIKFFMVESATAFNNTPRSGI